MTGVTSPPWLPSMSPADPVSPRCAEQAAAFSARQSAGLAGAVLAAAGQVAADPGASLADRVVARQAVHRVRADLDLALRDQLSPVQRALIRGLETLGDPEAHRDPLAQEAISAALAAGAAIGLEARVWAAADLLGRDGDREQALTLAGQVTTELKTWTSLGEAGDQWRLLLAFAAGKAGRPAITQRLLAPMLSSRTASREKAAQTVLRAVDGPRAGTRLQIILLQAELEATPAAADQDQLRLHAALAAAYNDLGIYPEALAHGRQELALRQCLQRPDHPRSLGIRANIAGWTGDCGDAAGALRLFTALLTDRERLLGPDHPNTLATRLNIAFWTAQVHHRSPDRPLLVELGGLAGDAVAAGDTAAAASYCEQMVAAAEEVLGAGDIRLTGYLRRAASALAAVNQDAQAIEALKRTVTINDRYDAETAEAVSDLRDLAELQQRNGPHQEAQQKPGPRPRDRGTSQQDHEIELAGKACCPTRPTRMVTCSGRPVALHGRAWCGGDAKKSSLGPANG